MAGRAARHHGTTDEAASIDRGNRGRKPPANPAPPAVTAPGRARPQLLSRRRTSTAAGIPPPPPATCGASSRHNGACQSGAPPSRSNGNNWEPVEGRRAPMRGCHTVRQTRPSSKRTAGTANARGGVRPRSSGREGTIRRYEADTTRSTSVVQPRRTRPSPARSRPVTAHQLPQRSRWQNCGSLSPFSRPAPSQSTRLAAPSWVA